MVIDEGGEPSSALGENATAVQGLGSRFVNRLPASHLSPPGQIRVFSIGKEIFIQILIPKAHVFEHFLLAQERRSGDTKDELTDVILSAIFFFTSPVKVPLGRSKEHPCAIQDGEGPS